MSITAEMLLNAMGVGLGTGIGSYFGIRFAENGIKHLRHFVSNNIKPSKHKQKDCNTNSKIV
jgi:hypothetical protein